MIRSNFFHLFIGMVFASLLASSYAGATNNGNQEGYPDGYTEIIEALRSEEPFRREIAIYVLEDVLNGFAEEAVITELMPELIDLLGDDGELGFEKSKNRNVGEYVGSVIAKYEENVIVRDSIISALQHPNWRVRLVATKQMKAIGQDDDIPLMLVGLKDEVAEVRFHSVLSLLEINHRDPLVLSTIAGLINDPNPYVQFIALQPGILVRQVLDNYQGHLTCELAVSKSPIKRIVYAFFLAEDTDNKVDDQKRQDLLLLLHDQDWLVRIAALEAVNHFINPAVINSVGELLEDKNILVRLAAIEVLGDGEIDEVSPYLFKALEDENLLVRGVAALSLADIGYDYKKVEPILEQLLESKVSSTVIASMTAIAMYNPAKGKELLEKMLATKNKDIQAIAIDVIGDLKSNEAYELLNNHVGYLSSELKVKALTHILQGWTDIPVVFLTSKLHSENARIRGMAVKAIFKKGGQQAVEASLIGLTVLGDINSDKRYKSDILSYLQSSENLTESDLAAIAEIARSEPSSDLQARAIRLLALRGLPELKKICYTVIRNGENVAKRQAILALGRVGGSDDLSLLVEQLNADDAGIRFVATLALFDLRDQRSVESLMKSLVDEDERVRQGASLAIAYNLGQDENRLEYDEALIKLRETLEIGKLKRKR